MNDDVSEIDENPGSVGITLDSRNGVAVAPGCLGDRIGDGASLDFRTPRDDRKGIGKDRPSANVERRESFSFFVERALADDVDQLADTGASVEALRARRSEVTRKVSRVAPVRSRSASSHSSLRSGKARAGSSESAK